MSVVFPPVGGGLASSAALSAVQTDVDSIQTVTDTKVAGRGQCSLATIDLNQAAASYDLFTGTAQNVVIDRLMFRMPNDDISSNGTLTSIVIVTDDVTPQTFVGAVAGAVANLTAEAQLVAAIDGILLKTGKKVRLTIAGGAVGRSVVTDVVAEYRSVIDGGYLS